MNVVIYARYSSNNQTEQSIEGQVRDCKAYCKRMGYKVIELYIDRALSAFKNIDKRDEFQRMIQDARKGQFEMVVVYAFDRFARNRYDSVVFKHKLKEYGVKVFSVTESFGEADESMPYEAMLEWAAENYSRALGKNASRGMRESALKGQTTGGHVPFGFKCIDKKFVIDENTAPAVRLMFDMYAGGKTKSQIAAALNERGFRTSAGARFTFNNITHMLENRRYIGDYTYKSGTDGEIKRTCPRIVEDSVFKACADRAEREKKAYGHKRSKVEYMLSGKLFCGNCGAAMTGDVGTSRDGTPHYYYTCHNRKKKHTCNKKSENLEYIENYVVDRTVRFILAPGRVEAIAKKIAAFHKKDCGGDKIAAEERRAAALDKELNACVDALIKTNNKTAIDRINERIELLERQKEDAETAVAKLKIAADMALTEDDCLAWLKTFCAGDIADPDYRRQIIYAFINSIFIYDDKIVIYYNVGDLSDGKPLTLAESDSYISAAPPPIPPCSDSSLNGQPLNAIYYVFVYYQNVIYSVFILTALPQFGEKFGETFRIQYCVLRPILACFARFRGRFFVFFIFLWGKFSLVNHLFGFFELEFVRIVGINR